MESLKQSLFSWGVSLSGGRAFERMTADMDKPRLAQERLLSEILKANTDTMIGRKYSFQKIRNVRDYQAAVPVHEYEDLRELIEHSTRGFADTVTKGKPLFYATTSGSTGKMKYIPMSEEAERRTNAAFSKATAFIIQKQCPQALLGKILQISGASVEGYTDWGIPYGSATGNVTRNVSRLVRSRYALPPQVADIKDVEHRYYLILRLCLDQNITFIGTANPSTLLILAQKLHDWQDELLHDLAQGTCARVKLHAYFERVPVLKPQPELASLLRQRINKDKDGQLRPYHLWPQLSLLTCWTGGNCRNYLDRLPSYYGQVAIKDPGYLASELRGTLPLRLNDPAGVLTINDNFYEFVPVEEIDAPTRFLLADELERNRRYYVFITNFSGLYRYNIHDIVEVTSFHKKTPEIVFVQKGKGITSITGEKLFETQVIDAVQEVARTLAKSPAFHMTFANVEEARYETYVEGDYCEDELHTFARYLEEALGRLNMEYKAKRDSLRLKPLIVRRAGPRAYERFKRWRVEQGVRETQFKMTYLTQEKNFVHVIAPA
jgi:hypothetical protein